MSITQARFTTQLRTWVLIAALTGLLIAIGALLGGSFVYIFAVFAVLMNVFGYWFSDKIALKASRAKPVSEQEAPALYKILRDLTARAELPMPRVWPRRSRRWRRACRPCRSRSIRRLPRST